jgi:hypothetical protein
MLPITARKRKHDGCLLHLHNRFPIWRKARIIEYEMVHSPWIGKILHGREDGT